MDAETIKKAVKPLEWIDANHGIWKAYSPASRYSILHQNHAPGYEVRRDRNFVGAGYGNADDAKAAAQADYEARIISALSPEFLSALTTAEPNTYAISGADFARKYRAEHPDCSLNEVLDALDREIAALNGESSS